MKRLANAGPTAMGLVGCGIISLILLAFSPWVRANYYTWQGDRLEHSGQLEAAQTDYIKALAVRRTPVTLEKLADTYTQQHRPTAAVALLREAVKMAPQDPDVHYKLGVGLLNTGDAANARDQLQEAVRLDHRNGMAHLALNKLAERHDDPLATARELEASLRNGAPNASAHLQIGEIYLSQGDDKAEGEFRAALAIDPSLNAAHLRLGLIMMEREPSEAADQLHLSLSGGQISKDDRARALAALSLLSYNRKNTLAANDYLSQAAALRPATAVQAALSYGAGVMRWNSGDRLGAFRYFNTAQEQRPGDPAFHEAALVGRLAIYGNALTAERQGRLGDAENGLRHLVALLPGEPEYRIRLGCVMLARRESSAAVSQFRKALSVEPNNPEGWLKLSAALLQEGRNEESLAALNQGIQVAPYWTQLRPDVDLLMGRILLACNRPQDAVRFLQYAVGTHSPHVNITEGNALLQLANAQLQPAAGSAVAQVTTSTTVQPGSVQVRTQVTPAQPLPQSPPAYQTTPGVTTFQPR